MQVLLIGFGNIGVMKSRIWRNNGHEVFVIDTNKEKRYLASKKNFEVLPRITESLNHDFDIIDISVPSGKHIQILEDIIKKRIPYKKILLEKPLFSNLSDFEKLTHLLQIEKNLRQNLVVNEQYYYSRITRIKNFERKLTKSRYIKISMSKNRLEDQRRGRFIDENIGPYGIEFPHILALSDILGFKVKNCKVILNDLYVKRNTIGNNGLKVILQDINGNILDCESFLGDFLIDGLGNVMENQSILRSIDIDNKYKIIFDPHPVKKRFITELQTANKHIFFKDNMLDESLKNINNKKNITKLRKILLDNKFILDLRKDARIVNI